VDDLDAKVKLIEEAGGFIVDPPLDLASGSRICLFNEPLGVALAMIQPASKTWRYHHLPKLLSFCSISCMSNRSTAAQMLTRLSILSLFSPGSLSNAASLRSELPYQGELNRNILSSQQSAAIGQ
jgi:hypothetical protein